MAIILPKLFEEQCKRTIPRADKALIQGLHKSIYRDMSQILRSHGVPPLIDLSIPVLKMREFGARLEKLTGIKLEDSDLINLPAFATTERHKFGRWLLPYNLDAVDNDIKNGRSIGRVTVHEIGSTMYARHMMEPEVRAALAEQMKDRHCFPSIVLLRYESAFGFEAAIDLTKTIPWKLTDDKTGLELSPLEYFRELYLRSCEKSGIAGIQDEEISIDMGFYDQ